MLLSVPTTTSLASADDVHQSDIQIVLGGNTSERGHVVFEVWKNHSLPILISGIDGFHIKQLLMDKGLPEDSIELESNSKSTWENAQFSTSIPQDRRVKSATIVTSEFHSSRALSSFKKAAPLINFRVVYNPKVHLPVFSRIMVHLLEKKKRIYDGLRFGISPWNNE